MIDRRLFLAGLAGTAVTAHARRGGGRTRAAGCAEADDGQRQAYAEDEAAVASGNDRGGGRCHGAADVGQRQANTEDKGAAPGQAGGGGYRRYAGRARRHGLILGYAGTPETEIEHAVRALRKVLLAV